MHNTIRLAVAALVALPLGACATNGALHRAVDAQNAALAQERAARVAADSANAADIASLRTDLQNLRTEFDAKITAMGNDVQFAFPVHFAFDDAGVRAEDTTALARFAHVVQKHYAGSKITVEGFADPAGTNSYNLRLSQRRAEAVRSYLAQAGLSNDEVRAVGYGEARLVAPGAQKDMPGAQDNRRVVFVVETQGNPTVASIQ